MSSLIYRSEIDGLRAIAVLLVVLFHAELTYFEYGFLGVDVFFVISGYLISKIIIRSIAEETFSFSYFYERRIRRLFPALFTVIAMCIPLSWILMKPDDLQNFGQSVVATLFFSNNILLSMTSDYWSPAVHFKPLLHTWSLGVEEQFYFIFPVLIFITYKYFKKYLVFVIALSTLMGVWIFWNTGIDGSKYYWPQLRSWEFTIGSLVAVSSSSKLQEARYAYLITWFAAIIFCLALIPAMPVNLEARIIAIVISIGFMLMMTGCDNAIIGVLRFRPLVGIGLISYGFYLFHQPLFAFARLSSQDHPDITTYAALILLAMFFSWLTLRFIENPCRDRKLISFSRLSIILSIIAFLLLSFGLSAHFSVGFKERSGLVSGQINFIEYNERVREFQADKFKTKKKNRVLVIGDSTARDVANMYLEFFPESEIELIYRSNFNHCTPINDAQFSLLTKNSTVIVFSELERRISGDCVDNLESSFMRDKVLFFGVKDFGYNLNWIMRKPSDERQFLKNKINSESVTIDLTDEKNSKELHYVSLLRYMSKNNEVTITDADGCLLSADGIHVSQCGAIYIGSRVLSKIYEN